VVVYQDLALKRPGFRLSWMTVSDEAIKSEQAKATANRNGKKSSEKTSG
jgi:hypothetical protein